MLVNDLKRLNEILDKRDETIFSMSERINSLEITIVELKRKLESEIMMKNREIQQIKYKVSLFFI